MKLSLKSYLLGLSIGILVVTAGVIIVSNYYTMRQVNTQSSKKILLSHSKSISSKVDNYLGAVESALNNGFMLIKPQPENLHLVLIQILKNNPLVTAAYQGDSAGNFYMAQRIGPNQFATVNIRRSKENPDMIESIVNRYGKTITSKDSAIMPYDPRIRPWYKKAVSSKKQSWSNIYRFQAFSNIPDHLGMTLSRPMYDNSGKLTGVFALDVALPELAHYLSNITPEFDSAIFLVDSNKNIKKLLLAENVRKSAKFTLPNTEKLNDLNLPWAEYALTKLQRKNIETVQYKHDGSKNIAAISRLDNGWHIVVARSLNSMLEPYTLYSLAIVGFGIALLLIGIAGCFFLILKICHPFSTVLATISNIKELKFPETERPKSQIIEINTLYDTIDLIERGFKSFAMYVPLALIQKLMSTGAVATVSGESREITTLFTDIRSFTAVAEGMQPRELMSFLSEYFEGMTNVISSKGGTLDKYIGDAIMAFWGAPFDDKNHALHACQTALMLQSALERLNKVWKQKGLPALTLRMGVNTGHSVVGNVGSRTRLSYTAMGDSVNLASRLEALNKIYGTDILVGEDTYRAVSDQFMFRLVDSVEVRGKKKSSYIYELLSREKFKLSTAELKEFNDKFYRAFNIYRVGDWERALTKFEELAEKHPEDNILTIFVKRCKILKENPPKQWSGAWNYSQ